MRIKIFKYLIFSQFILLFCFIDIQDTFADESDFYIEKGVLLNYVGAEANVIIPDTVTKIGPGAFKHCKSLTQVTIPDSVVSIESMAFYLCENLTEITIPASVSTFGWNVFGLTPWLEKKQKENPIVIINNTIVDGCKANGCVSVPKSVTGICEGAFASNNGMMTQINIPDTVTYIGNCAFNACPHLETVIMGNGVTYLGAHAFDECYNLKRIKLSNSLSTIPEGAFFACDNLTQITIPESVTSIEDASFQCNKLNKVTISDKTKSISGYSFPSSREFTIYGMKGSYIQSFAEKNHYNFKVLAVATSKITLSVGKTKTLSLNSNADCEWKSSNSKIATVDQDGKVTAKKKGKVTIKAILYGKKYAFTVTVK